MLVLIIARPKCTLTASHAAPGTVRQTDRRQNVTLRSPLWNLPCYLFTVSRSVTLPAVGHKCLLIIENRDVRRIDGINQSIMSKSRRVERDFVPILA